MIDRESLVTMNRDVIAEFRARNGIVGGAFTDIPILLLHHVGARTGCRRTNPLAYLEVDSGFAVFASNGGSNTHPDWYHNLVANPAAQVDVGTRRLDVVARVTDGDERQQIWTRQKMRNPLFADLERGTARTIPVIVLEPTSQRDGRLLSITGVAAADVPAVIDPLFREYGEWVARQLKADTGIVFTAADQARHHEAFQAELPGLVGTGGRLLVARLGDEPVGVGALKPVDQTTAEIKRMFVRPGARRRRIGWSLLARLVEDAGHEHYATVRLETLRFMTTAQAMYRNFGFAETAKFQGSETADTPFDPLTVAMEFNVAAAIEPRD